MAKAKELQKRYDALGASPYQSVRNPMPMHQLVLTVLPTLPDPSSMVDAKQTTRISAFGKSFLAAQTVKVNAYDTLGYDFYKQHGLTVDEIVAKLQSQGFIVRRGTVAVALNVARWNGKAHSMRFVRRPANPLSIRSNTSYCRYFAIAS